MPLVKETHSFRHLQKVITQADYGAISSSHMYDKMLGNEGINNRTFTLSKEYAVGSNTLMVFINGQKAELKESPSLANQYSETSSRVIDFGAALLDTDVIEFLVAGTWNAIGAVSGGSGGGSLTAVIVTASTTINVLERAICIAEQPITINLPLSPIAGEVCEIIDAMGRAETYNITINRNGKLIQGIADNIVIDTNGDAVFLVYINSTYGWKYILTGNSVEQVTGFRQYYSTVASAAQTTFNLPFSVDTKTKNIAVHVNGVLYAQDSAYTISSPKQIVFLVPLTAGDTVIFESFLASALGRLYSLEEAKLFKQSYSEIATAGQIEINLPFDVNVTTKNVSLYIGGVRQYVDDAFTITASNVLTLSNALAGNEKLLVESFNIGNFEDLIFSNNRYEALATDNQHSINLPFSYEMGTGNIAVTINGIRQSSTSFTEIDSTVIRMVDALSLNDKIMVESIVMGAFGTLENAASLGNVPAADYVTRLTQTNIDDINATTTLEELKTALINILS